MNFRLFKLIQVEALAGHICWHCYKEVDLITEYEKEVHEAIKRLKERISPLGENKVSRKADSDANQEVLEEDITLQECSADSPENVEGMDIDCFEDSDEDDSPDEDISGNEDDEVKHSKSGKDGLFVGKTYPNLDDFILDIQRYCASTNTVVRKVNYSFNRIFTT